MHFHNIISSHEQDTSSYFNNTSHLVDLAAEFMAVKKELIERGLFDKINFQKGNSAKIFLAIEHKDQKITETSIMQVDQTLKPLDIKMLFAGEIDLLFNNINPQIEFNNQDETSYKIIILLKDKDSSDQSHFSFVEGHGKKNGGYCIFSGGQSQLSNNLQKHFCQLVNLPDTPQIDMNGNFII